MREGSASKAVDWTGPVGGAASRGAQGGVTSLSLGAGGAVGPGRPPTIDCCVGGGVRHQRRAGGGVRSSSNQGDDENSIF